MTFFFNKHLHKVCSYRYLVTDFIISFCIRLCVCIFIVNYMHSEHFSMKVIYIKKKSNVQFNSSAATWSNDQTLAHVYALLRKTNLLVWNNHMQRENKSHFGIIWKMAWKKLNGLHVFMKYTERHTEIISLAYCLAHGLGVFFSSFSLFCFFFFRTFFFVSKCLLFVLFNFGPHKYIEHCIYSFTYLILFMNCSKKKVHAGMYKTNN